MQVYLAKYEIFVPRANDSPESEGFKVRTNFHRIEARNREEAQDLAIEHLPEIRRMHRGYTSRLAELVEV